MSLFSLLLILHVAIAITSVVTASMSFFMSSFISPVHTTVWLTYGLTIVSGIGLFMLVPSTLGRTCAMMAVLTPLVLLAHRRLSQKAIQLS